MSLVEVAEYRRAARLIIRARDMDFPAQGRALVRLARRAVRRDATGWLYRAVFEECRGFLGLPTTEMKPPPFADPVRRRLAEMVFDGLVQCPECRRPLPGETTLRTWHEDQAAYVRELQRREGAA